MDEMFTKQVTATFARNNFKAVNDQALKEGLCVIVKKSKPITVLMSFNEYEKLKNKKVKPTAKKVSIRELRTNSRFSKFIGCLEKFYANKSSLELQHNWGKYVD